MAISAEALDNYRKNLWCLREVTDMVLGRLKGHDVSYLRDITDKSGAFDGGKLWSFVGDILSGWEEERRRGVYPDRPGGESSAEGYIRERRELFGLYLYLTMRCSLCDGAYADVSKAEEERERADFAYILEKAREFSRGFCVMEDREGNRWNEPYEGFDAYFGFHLYRALTDPEGQSSASALTMPGRLPAQNLDLLTNMGNMKRIFIKSLSHAKEAEYSGDGDDPGGERDDGDACEEYDEYDYGDGDSGDYDPKELWETEEPFGAADLEELSERYERDDAVNYLAARFCGRDEYLEACGRFVSLYRSAPEEVLRGFYEELEEAVNLYLLRRGLTVLTDTDKALDVYSRVFDGPCRQAGLYERGLIWSRR